MTTQEASSPDGTASDHITSLQRLENSSARATLLILIGIGVEILAILIFPPCGYDLVGEERLHSGQRRHRHGAPLPISRKQPISHARTFPFSSKLRRKSGCTTA
jgi:hypothetical protein